MPWPPRRPNRPLYPFFASRLYPFFASALPYAPPHPSGGGQGLGAHHGFMAGLERQSTAPAAAISSTASTASPASAPFVASHKSRVVVWHSPRPTVLKYHLDPTCRGLEQVRNEDRVRRVFSSALSLLRETQGRPCRLCSFEPVLMACLTSPWLTAGPKVRVEFSGQPNPHEDASGSYAYRTVSESGAARLERLAVVMGLAVAMTQSGPVAHGLLSRRMAAIVGRNLRLVVDPYTPHVDAPARRRPPSAAPREVGDLEVAIRWVLLNDAPPDASGTSTTLDPWVVSAAAVVPRTLSDPRLGKLQLGPQEPPEALPAKVPETVLGPAPAPA